MDKELKNMQILEEEKSKLDAFCEQSLKNAMTQERRRYGFVLERQCSLAKHYASFHEVALAALHPSVDEWREVAATREYLPQSVEDMFASRLRQVSFWPEDEENGGSELTLSSQLRKTRSMDSSCLELRLGPPPGNPPANHGAPLHHIALSRARSEANLHASSLSLGPEVPETPPRPRSMAPASRSSGIGCVGGVGTVGGWGDAPLARALFAYLSSGENQLSFLEGDLIALMGDRQKGWQFGENLRTQSSGWFPLAYTEIIIDDSLGSPSRASNSGRTPEPRVVPPCKPPPSRPPVTPSIDETTPSNSSHTPTNMSNSNSSQNIATPTLRQANNKPIRPSGTLPAALAGGRRVQPPVPPVPPPQAITSLHSSNDSGFSNEPPVQPDIDYSDDEAMRQRRKPRIDRISEAMRAAAAVSKLQSSQESDNNSAGGGKDWQNDSWKTIPKDEKSWQLYKSAMDLWADVNQGGEQTCDEKSDLMYKKNRHFDNEDDMHNQMVDNRRSGNNGNGNGEMNQHNNRHQGFQSNPRVYARNSIERASGKLTGQENYDRNAVREYASDYEAQKRTHQERPNPNQRNKSRDRDRETPPPRYPQRRIAPSDDYKLEKQSVSLAAGGQKYGANEYTPKYENKAQKYYEDDAVDGGDQSTLNNRGGYQPVSRGGEDRDIIRGRDKIDNSDSESEDSTITMPESGRKVEHIAQKLEQTAQKYARGISPSKFNDPSSAIGESSSPIENDQDHKFENEETERGRRSFARDNNKRNKDPPHRYFEREQQPSSRGYERERSGFEKSRNVERASSRRFAADERPRPPFEEAPERPTSDVALGFRERRYSDKEEAIYGETGTRLGRSGSSYVEKERGYESNFETKLERTKVVEKHSYHRVESPLKFDKNGQKIADQNDSNNNNTLQKQGEKKFPTRQNTVVGSLIGHGSSLTRGFDIEAKSPKLVKRTKSFWRFRRDSDVLEGMALWQHRSLVDIPKMLKREERERERTKEREKERERDKERDNERERDRERERDKERERERERERADREREREREREQRERSRKSTPEDGASSSGRNSDKDHPRGNRETGGGGGGGGGERPRDRIEEPKPAERIHKPEKSDHPGFSDEFPTPAERPKATERSEYRMQHEERGYFVGNISRKAIIENERKRSLEAKQNMVVAELKETNEVKKTNERRKKAYGNDDDDGLIQTFSETEASDEESTYSCIVVKDQVVAEKTLLPRTKLRKDSDRDKGRERERERERDRDRDRERERNTCGPWYDLWGVDPSVKTKK